MSVKRCFQCGKPYTYFPQHHPVCPGETVRTSPYGENPQRRLRRLRRLFTITRERFSEFAPMATMGVIHQASWDWEDVAEATRLRFSKRVEKANQLIQIELEWACKTAMLSIGGEW